MSSSTLNGLSPPPAPAENESRRDHPAGSAAKAGGILRTTSRELLQNRSELCIMHEGREYRLRVTQNGKLILTA